MNVEVISVGTELLLGQIVNTNLATIGQALAEAGLDTFRQVVVGDNLERLAQEIRRALDESDAVILTGGIGERGPGIREKILEGLDAQGVELDHRANAIASGCEADVSTPRSPIRVLVVPTNEELMIARDTLAVAQQQLTNCGTSG